MVEGTTTKVGIVIKYVANCQGLRFKRTDFAIDGNTVESYFVGIEFSSYKSAVNSFQFAAQCQVKAELFYFSCSDRHSS